MGRGGAGPQISLRNVLGRLEVATVEAVASAWHCARKTGWSAGPRALVPHVLSMGGS